MGSVAAIVSAYYTQPGWLEGRIQNLLDQEGVDLEIVIIAQLNSEEHQIIMEAIGDNYLRKIYFYLTREIPTIYEAWNMAIEKAHGDYITNANTDDRLYPGSLARMAQVLDDNPDIAAVYGNVGKMATIGGDLFDKFDWASGGLAALQHGCFLGPMPMWRRSLHEQYGYFDPQMTSAGDYEYWLRLAFHGEKFIKIPDPIVGAYLDRPDSAEKRNRFQSAWEAFKAQERYSLKESWMKWRDYHEGESCYILGNGPSLKDVDLESLTLPTFGSNRIYLSGYHPTYHVTCNPLVLEQFGHEIAQLDSTLFRSGYEIDTTQEIPGFYSPTGRMYEGHTVTYVMMQIAYYMGFQEVRLLGVDHDYGQLNGAPNELQILEGPDNGHFHPDYFKGAAWHLPDLERSEQAYKMADQVYRAAGRKIYNDNPLSKLDVFERKVINGITV